MRCFWHPIYGCWQPSPSGRATTGSWLVGPGGGCQRGDDLEGFCFCFLGSENSHPASVTCPPAISRQGTASSARLRAPRCPPRLLTASSDSSLRQRRVSRLKGFPRGGRCPAVPAGGGEGRPQLRDPAGAALGPQHPPAP